MKTFDIAGNTVVEGIAVVNAPYPHVLLGEGGNKRATWVAIGKRDIATIVHEGKVTDVGVIALKNEDGTPKGTHLIVAPHGSEDRVLVIWRVRSGYRGNANITAPATDGVTIIDSDKSWHSGQGNLGETAEVMAILKPGQKLLAVRSGRRLEQTHGMLVYDGNGEFEILFGTETMYSATTDEFVGEYV